MAEPLRLIVWTPSETLIDAQNVEWVHVELAGEKGLTIWPGHLPMLGETTADALRYADRTETHVVDLAPGIVQVEGHTVTIFVAGTIDEPAWPHKESVERFDRLSEALLETLAQDERPDIQSPGAP